MPGSKYTPDLSRLSSNASAIRDNMLRRLRGPQEEVVRPLPVPGTPRVSVLSESDLRGLGVPRAQRGEPLGESPVETPAEPLGQLYGAAGDPWTYEVRPDGRVRARSEAGQWIDLAPGTTMYQAVQEQVAKGVLQPGQGAAAAAAPEPPAGGFVNPDLSPEQQQAVLDVEGSGLQSEAHPTEGGINPITGQPMASSQYPARDLIKQLIREVQAEKGSAKE